jgi:uncharacterized protein YqgC (DUF456 family)
MTGGELTVTLVTLALMLVGLVGVLIPVIPDVWLIWLAGLGYGLLTGWDGWLGGLSLALLTLFTLAGVAVDLVLGPVAARRGGASWQAIGASLALGLLGLFLLPPFGALIGAVLGLFVVEYRRRGRNTDEAVRVVKDYIVGCGWSVVLRVALALLMILTWGVWVWLG